MDYDHPYRGRAVRGRHLCSLLLIGGTLGLLWPAAHLISFLQLRARSSSTEATVVGYEVAGGAERLRVKVLQPQSRAAYMLLDTKGSTRRYQEGQRVELLSRPVANALGQTVEQTVVYGARNYWQWPAVAAAGSALMLAGGAAGILRLRQAGAT
jgi:hypothetical protein